MDNRLPALADALETELRGRAGRYGWSTVTSPEALLEGNDLGIDSVLHALPLQSSNTCDEELPTFRRAFDLQPASLSLLLCGLDGDHPDRSYRAALWWAGLVRSRSTPIKRADLHLFLIAPPGSDQQVIWKGRRSRFETDERFCRKFVWLPSREPKAWEIDAFLDRTFLAEPWNSQSAEPRSLDPLERLVDDIGVDSSLTSDEARRWIARLGAAHENGFQQMAEDLVAILEGKR